MGTPQSWSTPIDQSTDAAYNTWGAEFSTKLAAAGATQSGDTGQIAWGARTRAGANTDDGYQIWYITGALHATAPVYVKFYFGSGSANTVPRIRVEIGTGTNGTGTITGTAKTAVTTISAGSGVFGVTNRASYMCCNNGSLWMSWKVGASSVGPPVLGAFAVHRTCDSSGAFDGGSVYVDFLATSFSGPAPSQVLEFSPSAVARTAVSSTFFQSFVPGNNTTSTTSGGDNQLYLAWATRGNQATPIPGKGTIFLTEAPDGNTFTASPIGGTSRTYISTGIQNGGGGYYAGAISNIGTAQIWEA